VCLSSHLLPAHGQLATPLQIAHDRCNIPLPGQIFSEHSGVDPAQITRAIDAGCTPVLVHEQSGGEGYIRFRQLIQQTPAVLKAAPYSLYDTPATPLYPTPEHRKACMLSVLREMAAIEESRGTSRRFGRLSSWARIRIATNSSSRMVVRRSPSLGAEAAEKRAGGSAMNVYATA
jgi:hypothetical protein